jgi:hypothetical protein
MYRRHRLLDLNPTRIAKEETNSLGNASGLCSEGARFESCPESRLLCLFVVGFLQLLQTNAEIITQTTPWPVTFPVRYPLPVNTFTFEAIAWTTGSAT